MTSTKRALLIGSNYLTDPRNRLRGCIDDVVNMNKLLISTFHYEPHNITILRDDVHDVTVHPTRANIISNIKRVVAETTSVDALFIHYSGHGAQIDGSNKTE